MMETIPKPKKTTPLLESPFLHPNNETIPIHCCHVFVVTVPWRKHNFPTRFKRHTRLVKG